MGLLDGKKGLILNVANNRSIAVLVIEMQPAVGAKFARARCRNTALPRPLMRGWAL